MMQPRLTTISSDLLISPWIPGNSMIIELSNFSDYKDYALLEASSHWCRGCNVVFHQCRGGYYSRGWMLIFSYCKVQR